MLQHLPAFNAQRFVADPYPYSRPVRQGYQLRHRARCLRMLKHARNKGGWRRERTAFGQTPTVSHIPVRDRKQRLNFVLAG